MSIVHNGRCAADKTQSMQGFAKADMKDVHRKYKHTGHAACRFFFRYMNVTKTPHPDFPFHISTNFDNDNRPVLITSRRQHLMFAYPVCADLTNIHFLV